MLLLTGIYHNNLDFPDLGCCRGNRLAYPTRQRSPLYKQVLYYNTVQLCFTQSERFIYIVRIWLRKRRA